MEYTVFMQTNDLERLKAEIRYLRNCLLEAHNALPSLPCTSLESWFVVDPLMRAMRSYDSSFDKEFEPAVVSKKRRRVSHHLSRPVEAEELVTGRASPMQDVKVKIDNNLQPEYSSVAKSLGF